MKNMPEGLITGGIECIAHHGGGARQVGTVFDLASWIKSQFIALRETVTERHRNGESRPVKSCIICIGDDQHFALLLVTLSTYRAIFLYQEHTYDEPCDADSPNIDRISTEVASRALRY